MAARRKKRRRELSVGLLSVGAEEGWGVSIASLMADLLFRDRVEASRSRLSLPAPGERGLSGR
jgi:hypothetical protein